MSFTLRPYQEAALDRVFEFWTKHGGEPAVLSCCVGGGKSILGAAIIRRMLDFMPTARVTMLVPSKELLQQNGEKLRALLPGVSVGIVSASVGRKELYSQITLGTIGSLRSHALRQGLQQLVIIDECHLVSNKERGMYRTYLAELGKTCPHLAVLGMTGTPFQGAGSVWLTADKESLFKHIVHGPSISELLELGYLAPLVPIATETQIDTSEVSLVAGDYNQSELEAASDKPEVVESAANEIVRLASDRKHWLVFCVGIQHATHMRDALRARGITSEMVSGNTPKDERAKILGDFKAGRIRSVCNVGVLLTGYDFPALDCLVMLRATKSAVLYTQAAGRGLRCAGANIHESIRNGKADCAWIDMAGVAASLGPVDAIKGRLPSRKGKGEAPFRVCPECGSRSAAGATECGDCGFQFPPPERIKHGAASDGAAVLSSQIAQDITHKITHVDYCQHHKLGAEHVSLRVEYWAGPVCVAKQWQFPEMKGYRRLEFEAWWRQRCQDGGPIPSDTAAAVQRAKDGALATPPGIVTRRNSKTKHHDIIGFVWRNEEDE